MREDAKAVRTLRRLLWVVKKVGDLRSIGSELETEGELLSRNGLRSCVQKSRPRTVG